MWPLGIESVCLIACAVEWVSKTTITLHRTNEEIIIARLRQHLAGNPRPMKAVRDACWHPHTGHWWRAKVAHFNHSQLARTGSLIVHVGHKPTVVLCKGVRARHEDTLSTNTGLAVVVAFAPASLEIVLQEFVILTYVKGVAISCLTSD